MCYDISGTPSAGISPDIGYAFELGWAEIACNMICLGPLQLGGPGIGYAFELSWAAMPPTMTYIGALQLGLAQI